MRSRMELYSKEELRRIRNAARRKRHVPKKKGRGADALILLLFLVVCMLCITLRVQGNTADACGYDEEMYGVLEEQYRAEVCGVLTDHGLYHSGVNLTKVLRPDGEREYRLEVHHAGIGRMTGAQRETLLAGLEFLSFPDQKSAVCVRLSF